MSIIRFFKIGVKCDKVRRMGLVHDYCSLDGCKSSSSEYRKKAQPGTGFEVQVVSELHEDIALKSLPFGDMSARLNVIPMELFDMATSLKERGILRRFRAVLHHG